MNNKKTPNERALNEIDWILQESWKRAVKLRGINDWSELGTGADRENAERDVEKYQLAIAKLLLETLKDIKFDDENERFQKRMEESDKRFEDKYGSVTKDEVGYRPKDETNIDKRDTDEIGKP